MMTDHYNILVVGLKAFDRFENTSDAESAETLTIDSKPSKGLHKHYAPRCAVCEFACARAPVELKRRRSRAHARQGHTRWQDQETPAGKRTRRARTHTQTRESLPSKPPPGARLPAVIVVVASRPRPICSPQTTRTHTHARRESITHTRTHRHPSRKVSSPPGPGLPSSLSLPSQTSPRRWISASPTRPPARVGGWGSSGGGRGCGSSPSLSPSPSPWKPTRATLIRSTGLNMKVCAVISIAQCLLWALWTVMARHPSRLKIIFVAIGGAVAVLLEAYDIPPRWGYVDGHAICLAVAIPLSYLCWSFAKEDAEMRTSAILKKAR